MAKGRTKKVRNRIISENSEGQFPLWSKDSFLYILENVSTSSGRLLKGFTDKGV